jgi:hypothetical protein
MHRNRAFVSSPVSQWSGFIPLVRRFNFKPILASGGTEFDILVSGVIYRVHSFTSTGANSFNITSSGSVPDVEYLIIGGGGAGEFTGSGGGAGGYLTGFSKIFSANHEILVGAGGQVPTTTASTNASLVANNLSLAQGQNSSTFGIVAFGGGHGVSHGGGNGATGGSGSGAPIRTVAPAGVGGVPVSGQGNGGGNGFVEGGWVGKSGGGGGAGTAGTAGGNATTSGNGGNGLSSSITGTGVTRAGGGGGGGVNTSLNSTGGSGGGGNGAGSNVGSAGQASTGSGGGGGGYDGSYYRGGAGGSGIVIIRYPITDPN